MIQILRICYADIHIEAEFLKTLMSTRIGPER